jgi:hypothetical protein
LKAAHGVANRASAYPEFGREISLDKPGIRGQLIIKNPVPQSAAHCFWQRHVLKNGASLLPFSVGPNLATPILAARSP